MIIILNVVCNVQHKSNKARAFKRMQGTTGGVDLMIVDILKGLPVSMVPSLREMIYLVGRSMNSCALVGGLIWNQPVLREAGQRFLLYLPRPAPCAC